MLVRTTEERGSGNASWLGKTRDRFSFLCAGDVKYLWASISIVWYDVRGFISGVDRISISPFDVMLLFCFIDSRLS